MIPASTPYGRLIYWRRSQTPATLRKRRGAKVAPDPAVSFYVQVQLLGVVGPLALVRYPDGIEFTTVDLSELFARPPKGSRIVI